MGDIVLVHVLKTEVILLNDVQVVEHLLKQVLTNGLFLQKKEEMIDIRSLKITTNGSQKVKPF